MRSTTPAREYLPISVYGQVFTDPPMKEISLHPNPTHRVPGGLGVLLIGAPVQARPVGSRGPTGCWVDPLDCPRPGGAGRDGVVVAGSGDDADHGAPRAALTKAKAPWANRGPCTETHPPMDCVPGAVRRYCTRGLRKTHGTG
jgi:hypothetical protein